MKQRWIKVFLSIAVMVCITVANAQVYANQYIDLDIDVKSMQLNTAKNVIKNRLKALGAPDGVANKVSELSNNNTVTFEWEIRTELRLPEKEDSLWQDFKDFWLTNTNRPKFKIEIYINGEYKSTYPYDAGDSYTLTFSTDEIAKINNAVKNIYDLPIGFTKGDFNSEITSISWSQSQSKDYSGYVLASRTENFYTTATLQTKTIGSEEYVTGAEIESSSDYQGATYIGSKPRPEWYMNKLQASTGDMSISPVDDPDYYDPGELTDFGRTFHIADVIINIIKWVGASIAVIVIMVLGIKYLTGSVEEKADYKKTMIPYVVGCILLFAGSFIVQIIFDMVTGM